MQNDTTIARLSPFINGPGIVVCYPGMRPQVWGDFGQELVVAERGRAGQPHFQPNTRGQQPAASLPGDEFPRLCNRSPERPIGWQVFWACLRSNRRLTGKKGLGSTVPYLQSWPVIAPIATSDTPKIPASRSARSGDFDCKGGGTHLLAGSLPGCWPRVFG